MNQWDWNDAHTSAYTTYYCRANKMLTVAWLQANIINVATCRLLVTKERILSRAEWAISHNRLFGKWVYRCKRSILSKRLISTKLHRHFNNIDHGPWKMLKLLVWHTARCQTEIKLANCTIKLKTMVTRITKYRHQSGGQIRLMAWSIATRIKRMPNAAAGGFMSYPIHGPGWTPVFDDLLWIQWGSLLDRLKELRKDDDRASSPMPHIEVFIMSIWDSHEVSGTTGRSVSTGDLGTAFMMPMISLNPNDRPTDRTLAHYGVEIILWMAALGEVGTAPKISYNIQFEPVDSPEEVHQWKLQQKFLTCAMWRS